LVEALRLTLVLKANKLTMMLRNFDQDPHMNWQQRIQVDPAVCKGRACITAARITVSSVLDNLAEGMTVDAIVASYPPLTAADVHACMSYAAALAHEELVPLAA